MKKHKQHQTKRKSANATLILAVKNISVFASTGQTQTWILAYLFGGLVVMIIIVETLTLGRAVRRIVVMVVLIVVVMTVIVVAIVTIKLQTLNKLLLNIFISKMHYGFRQSRSILWSISPTPKYYVLSQKFTK